MICGKQHLMNVKKIKTMDFMLVQIGIMYLNILKEKK